MLPPQDDPRLLVDHSSGDDAGVLRLPDGSLLVQTVDFFTPVVDDPFEFGAIAAANALSDVYAMGGRPLSALSIACFPERDFPIAWAREIVRGGFEKLREAGCLLLGGHSVRDPEIKFGYAVTGTVEAGALMTNAGVQPGDALVLTKPLGTGVLATALKAGQAPADATAAATGSMATLNRAAASAAARAGVRAATDVTGFGLLGHAAALARASRVTLEFVASDLPLLPGALELALRFQPGGLKANAAQFEPLAEIAETLEPARRALLSDPQTSGGLLLAVAPGALPALFAELPMARVVGQARAVGERLLRVR